MTEQKTEQKTVIKAETIAEVFAEVDKAPAKPEPKITQPVNYDGFDVCAVRGRFGTYYRNGSNNGYIDFEEPLGETMSYTVDGWRDFIAELRKAALVLGVEL